jgi:NADH:ubiquinone oxidoreductase subunit 2 (subunit N)
MANMLLSLAGIPLTAGFVGKFVDGEEKSLLLRSPPLAGSLTLAGLMLGVVWLGVYPAPVMQVIQSSVASLVS